MSGHQCFIVFEDQRDEHGFIPSLVTEGEWGHAPLRGDPEKLQSPWYWGTTIEEAQQVCAAQNRRLGLTEDDVLRITASSMSQR